MYQAPFWNLYQLERVSVYPVYGNPRTGLLRPFWEPDRVLRSPLRGLCVRGCPKSADCKRGRKKGAARKLSKSVEKLFDTFWRFLTFFALRENCRKVSKNFLTLFDDFWRFLTWPLSAGPFCNPLTKAPYEWKQGWPFSSDAIFQEKSFFSCGATPSKPLPNTHPLRLPFLYYHLPRKHYPINSENFKSGNGNKK